MEITRRMVLEEALKTQEMIRSLSSKGGRGLVALKGYEEQLEMATAECRILRELIQALEYDEVRAAIAKVMGEKEKEPAPLRQWQMRVIRGEKQTGLFEDGHTTENGADHPEGRNVPGGTDHVQPGPAME